MRFPLHRSAPSPKAFNHDRAFPNSSRGRPRCVGTLLASSDTLHILVSTYRPPSASPSGSPSASPLALVFTSSCCKLVQLPNAKYPTIEDRRQHSKFTLPKQQRGLPLLQDPCNLSRLILFDQHRQSLPVTTKTG
jgi:hypothetical protein